MGAIRSTCVVCIQVAYKYLEGVRTRPNFHALYSVDMRLRPALCVVYRY